MVKVIDKCGVHQAATFCIVWLILSHGFKVTLSLPATLVSCECDTCADIFPDHLKTLYQLKIVYEWNSSINVGCPHGDLGLILSIPLPCVGPLMTRRLKTSSEVPVTVSG